MKGKILTARPSILKKSRSEFIMLPAAAVSDSESASLPVTQTASRRETIHIGGEQRRVGRLELKRLVFAEPVTIVYYRF